MKIFSKLFFVFATVSNAQEASVLDSHGFSEGVFDNTVLYESVDKRVRRQVDDIEGSVEPDDILSKVNLLCQNEEKAKKKTKNLGRELNYFIDHNNSRNNTHN